MQMWTTRFLFAVLIGAATVQPAVADPISFGLPANGAGCIPFGCHVGDRYQQVYAAEDFGLVTVFSGQVEAAPVPEPATMLRVGGGLGGALLARRRRCMIRPTAADIGTGPIEDEPLGGTRR